MTWDPEQYGRFREERSRPFHDLLDLVEPREGMRIVDLGCGDGTLTKTLHEHLAAADTLGVDSSEEMLARAAEHECEGLRFEECLIEAFDPDPRYDLVFSNAALQWIDDHEALFTRLYDKVAPGGQLAVQMPANQDQPPHVAMTAVAAGEPFRSALGGWVREAPVLKPEEYATLLRRIGFADVEVMLKVYLHELPDTDAVVEWMKGTALTPYESRMKKKVFTDFVRRYRERLLEDTGGPEPYLLTYNRVFLSARR